jgi:hypothetical protein
MTNLFISYDLMTPGKDYSRVHNAIKSLGTWEQLQFSLFYVHSPHTKEQAAGIVWAVMDSNDRLCVVDANGASVPNATPAQISAIAGIWNTPAKAA